MDSIEVLEQKLAKTDNPEEQFKILFEMASRPYQYGVDKGKEACCKGEIIAQQLGDTDLLIKMYWCYMRQHIYCGEYDEAQAYFDKGMARLEAEPKNNPLSYALLQRGLSEIYWSQRKLEKAEEIVQKTLQLDFSVDRNPKMIADLYYFLGIIQKSQQKYASSVESFNRALELTRQHHITLLRCNICNWLGMVHQELGNIEEALKYQFEGVEMAETICYESAISQGYNSLGLLYFDKKSYDLAKEYFVKSLELRIKIDDKRNLANTYHNLALVFSREEEYEQALTYFHKALDLRKNLGNHIYQGKGYFCIADIYTDMGDLSQARFYLQKAEEIYAQNQFLEGLLMATFHAIKIAVLEKNPQQAWEQLQRAEQLMQKNVNISPSDLLREKETYTKYLAQYHALQGNFKTAYELELEKADINQKIHTEKTQQIFANAQIRYEVEKREKEAELAKTQAKITHLKNNELRETNLRLQETNQKYAQVTRELEEMNQTKDKFFSIISHDLRSPFTVLLGMSQMLTQAFDQLTLPEIQGELTAIHESAQNYYKLLENLLNWSQLQMGKIQPQPTLFSVQSLLQNIVKLYKQPALAKQNQLTFHVDSQLYLQADYNMIYTSLRNIVANSIKFTDHGKIHIEGSKDSQEITIRVHDTGVGIPPNLQQNLFVLGQTISTYGTQQEPGTGLGLILCKDLLERNNASIEMASQPHQGTTVTLHFPQS